MSLNVEFVLGDQITLSYLFLDAIISKNALFLPLH